MRAVKIIPDPDVEFPQFTQLVVLSAAACRAVQSAPAVGDKLRAVAEQLWLDGVRLVMDGCPAGPEGSKWMVQRVREKAEQAAAEDWDADVWALMERELQTLTTGPAMVPLCP